MTGNGFFFFPTWPLVKADEMGVLKENTLSDSRVAATTFSGDNEVVILCNKFGFAADQPHRRRM